MGFNSGFKGLKNSTFFPQFMYVVFLWISEQKVISLHKTEWSLQSKGSVYCAVRIKFLHVIEINICLIMLSSL